MIYPMYETAEDRKAEREVADEVERLRNCKLEKIKQLSYNLDFSAIRQDLIVAFVETKRRHNDLTTFPTVWFPLLKWLRARQIYRELKLPCCFFVQFDDCLAWANLITCTFTLHWRGRNDRQDAEGPEPMLLIPYQQFKVVKK